MQMPRRLIKITYDPHVGNLDRILALQLQNAEGFDKSLPKEKVVNLDKNQIEFPPKETKDQEVGQTQIEKLLIRPVEPA